MRIKLAVTMACFVVISCQPATEAQQRRIAATPPVSAGQNRTGNRPGWRNNLPPTVLDSFVYEAHEHREHIYGDEGKNGLPPYEWFSKAHRINTGILDERDKGLTTGHGSYLPDAAGADEFLMPPNGEWSQSGSRGRTRAQGFVDGLPTLRPEPPQYVASNGDATGGNYDLPGGAGGDQTPADAGPQLPPPPGDGYMAVYQHGMFVGYIAPDEDMLAFVRSDRYLGGNMGRKSIEYELGARSTPF